MIISVGYRVNSRKATAFRRWATSIIKQYLIKGYAIDQRRLDIDDSREPYGREGCHGQSCGQSHQQG